MKRNVFSLDLKEVRDDADLMYKGKPCGLHVLRYPPRARHFFIEEATNCGGGVGGLPPPLKDYPADSEIWRKGVAGRL